MDPRCPQPPTPPRQPRPYPPAPAAPAAPSLGRRPTGFANLLNPSTPTSSSPLSPRPPPAPAPLQEPAPAATSDPWTSFFPQLPQTRRKRAPAPVRTRSDPDIQRAVSEQARTPSPYPRNLSDPSPGPFSQPPSFQPLPQPAQDWADAPQAVGWSGSAADEGRKRKRGSAERDDEGGSPGVRIADPSLPGGDASAQGMTFYRQVAPRRTVGDEPIMYVAGAAATADHHHFLPPPARQHRPSAAGFPPAPLGLDHDGPPSHLPRPSPPLRDARSLAHAQPSHPKERSRSRDGGTAAGRSSSRSSKSPGRRRDSGSPQAEQSRDRDNSLRVSGMPPLEHLHGRRLSAFQSQLRSDDDVSKAARRHSYSVDPLDEPLAQPWHPSSSFVRRNQHHHVDSISSRSNSIASLVFDDHSARSSLSVSSQDPPPFSSGSIVGVGAPSPPPGSPTKVGLDRFPPLVSLARHSPHASLHVPVPRPAPAVSILPDAPERESKRRRAGSLSNGPSASSAPTASQPQEPRRSSTPVDRKAFGGDGRSDGGYERHLDSTPRASSYDPRRPPQLPTDFPSSALLQAQAYSSHASPAKHSSVRSHAGAFGPSSGIHLAQHSVTGIRETKSASHTPTRSPPGSGSSITYARSDGSAASHGELSPRKRTPRAAPFSGTNRNFTFGSPTKPQTEPRPEDPAASRPPPLPTMWLAPPDSGAHADSPAGRHLRLPSLTDALRDLEVREAGHFGR